MRRLAVLALAALAAAGCGASHRSSAPRVPKLPRALAERLARESDAVASALARGDACSARRLADRLRADATASIGRVPGPLQEPLSSGVNAVAEAVPACAPPVTTPTAPVQTSPAPPPPPGKGHGKGHAHGHGKDGHGRGGGRGKKDDD